MVRLLKEMLAPAVEVSPRVALLESLLASPHGDLQRLLGLHRRVIQEDARFYTHLAAWYASQGALRDHLTLLLGELFLGSPSQREAAFVLLQPLRTFQVARLMRYLKQSHGRVTRSFRTAVERWLRRREAWRAWWEECALRDRASLKSLYAGLHIQPDAFAQAVLFDGRAPANTRLWALGELARGPAPARAVELITMYRLPFTAALGALRGMTPTLLRALVEVMSPAQVCNHLAAFKRHGLLEDAQLAQRLGLRLSRAAKDGLVSELKLVRAANFVPIPEGLVRELKRIANERLRARGALTVPTALLVDKSGSMELALEAGVALATLCSSVAKAPLYVWAFDEDAFEVRARGESYAHWEAAFADLKASGCTSIGAGVEALFRAGQWVEQLVLISDGQENTAPAFAEALRRYAARHGMPAITWLEVGGSEGAPLEKALAELPTPVLRLRFTGDFYSLPNLVPLLSPGGRAALVQEVLDTPIPTKADMARLPPGFDEETLEIL